MIEDFYSFDLIVSVVVYKPSLFCLQQTLDSLGQSHLKLKIIIFDNSKTPLDFSKLKINEHVEYFCNQKNIGFGPAHNRNIKKFSHLAPYFLILNPDVYFESLLLETMMERMSMDPRIGLSIPSICHPQGRPQLINRRLPRVQDFLISFVSQKLNTDQFKTRSYRKYQMADIDTTKPFVCPSISGCFMFFRSAVIKEMNGFDENFFLYVEDTDLSRRVAEKHQTVVFSDLVAYHHWTRGAYKNPKLFILFIQSLVYYFNKWGWFRDPQRETLNKKVQYYLPPKNAYNARLVTKKLPEAIPDRFVPLDAPP